MNIQKNEPFILASIREREMLTYFLAVQKDFEITQMSDIATFDRWDAVIISAYTEMLLETKVRDCKIDKFPDYILEEKKYNALCDVQNRMLKKRGRFLKKYYWNFFSDGLIIWDLDECVPSFVNKEMRKTTVVNNGTENKSVVMLDPKLGTTYKYNTSIGLMNEISEQKFKILYPNQPSYIKIK